MHTCLHDQAPVHVLSVDKAKRHFLSANHITKFNIPLNSLADNSDRVDKARIRHKGIVEQNSLRYYPTLARSTGLFCGKVSLIEYKVIQVRFYNPAVRKYVAQHAKLIYLI